MFSKMGRFIEYLGKINRIFNKVKVGGINMWRSVEVAKENMFIVRESYFDPDTFQSTKFEVQSTFEVDAMAISNSIIVYRFMERRDIDVVTAHVIIKPL